MPDVISNASVLIILDNIGMLWVLEALYKEIIITDVVHQEFGKEVEDWIKIKKVKDKNYFNIAQSTVDPGEASTIALALETQNPLLILDDDKARKLAKKLKLKYTGTLGVILKARKRGLISSVIDVIEQLKFYNFRMSDQLIDKTKKLSGESE
jgi:predicted nucleic acid-binding protein